MDDSVEMATRLHRDAPVKRSVYVKRKAKTGDWSCVDYQDDMSKTVYKYEAIGEGAGTSRIPKKELAEHLSDSTLSGRFKRETLANEPRENEHGSCRSSDIKLQPVSCTGDEKHKTNIRGDEMGIEDRWWTGKQTNRGWPGTAEGKMGTIEDYIILLAGHV